MIRERNCYEHAAQHAALYASGPACFAFSIPWLYLASLYLALLYLAEVVDEFRNVDDLTVDYY